MGAGDHVEREMERSVRVLFPDLAKGALLDTEFGALVLPSFGNPAVVLFRETDSGTLVEKREIKFAVSLRQLTHDEMPGITIGSKALPAEIATASISALRRALANARPPPRGGMRDGAYYYFFSRGTAGRAHTPGADTEAGRLVGLVGALLRFVEGEAEDADLRVAVENASRANHGSKRGGVTANLPGDSCQIGAWGRRGTMCAGRLRSLSASPHAAVQGSTCAPVVSKSTTFPVTTAIPCTMAVAAISASRSDRGSG